MLGKKAPNEFQNINIILKKVLSYPVFPGTSCRGFCSFPCQQQNVSKCCTPRHVICCRCFTPSQKLIWHCEIGRQLLTGASQDNSMGKALRTCRNFAKKCHGQNYSRIIFVGLSFEIMSIYCTGFVSRTESCMQKK